MPAFFCVNFKENTMSDQLPLICVNNQLCEDVYACDRGFSFGDGVFETLRWQGGSAPLLNYHLERLELGCQRLAISLSLTRLNGELQAFWQRLAPITDEAVVKIQVTRGEGGRGYAIDPNAFPTIVISAFAASDFSQQRAQGLELGFCRQPISSGVMLAGIKHLNRLENVLLKQEAVEQGYSDALVCDAEGRLIETTAANLFLVKEGKLLTPSLHRAGVAGVIRRLIIDELAPELGLDVVERHCPLDDLWQSEELFICNSLMGIVPVKRIDFDDQELHFASSSVESSVSRRLQCSVENRYQVASLFDGVASPSDDTLKAFEQEVGDADPQAGGEL